MSVTHYQDGIVRYMDFSQAISEHVIYCFTNAKTKTAFSKVAPLRIEFNGCIWLLSSVDIDPLGQYNGTYKPFGN